MTNKTRWISMTLGLIILVTIALLATGCSSDKEDKLLDNTKPILDDNSGKDEAMDSAGKTDNKQMELAGECGFLTAKDILEVCGKNVKMTDMSSLYGPCAVSFTNEAGRELKQIYYQYPADDNKERIYDYCISNTGEELEDSICIDPEEYNIYVYGDLYSISLGGDLNIDENSVCSFEEMKELGRILKKRIYG